MKVNDWVTAAIAVLVGLVAVWAARSAGRSAKADEQSLALQRESLQLDRQARADSEVGANEFVPRWAIIQDGDHQWLLWNQNGEPAENVVMKGRQDFAPTAFGTLENDQKGKFRCVLRSDSAHMVHVSWRRPNGEQKEWPVSFPWNR